MATEKKKKIITPLQAKSKAENFCAYQERCQQEVRTKIHEWGIYENDAENIIVQLISDGFLNEERFAKTFASGKFRIKKWGRRKIVAALKIKNISAYCIKSAISNIDEEEYLQTLQELIDKKWKELKGHASIIKSNKTATYAISRGFESEYVWEVLKKMEAEKK
jgi:regulatory protein